MDEPFSGLDPLIRRQMQDELVELQSKMQKTIIFVTHDLHEALKLGDRIAILRNGEVVQVGSPEEIITNPADEYVQEFVQDASPAKVLTARSIMSEIPVITYAWEGPNTALTLMRRQKKRMGYVVDKRQQFLGVITAKELKRLLNSEEKYKTIPATSIEHVESVHPDVLIEDLFSVAPQNPYPIPVVDEHNRLLGRISSETIFDSISSNGGLHE